MNTIGRRSFLGAGLAATAALSLGSAAYGMSAGDTVIRPDRLKAGDTVMLIAASSVEYNKLRLQLAIESLEALGLKVKIGKHVMGRHGYFPASDEDRAADLNAAFADTSVKAVIALKGGWGAARTLPYLDYEMIGKNPKILLGYSDVTALLNAIYIKTGLVTFHGPNGGSPWAEFSAQNVREILFEAKAQHMVNPQDKNGHLTVRKYRTQTISSGVAEGRLVGGNLTVLTTVQGTPYFPDTAGKILMLEDVGENIYRVDRMLTQLALGGHLDNCAGIIFGGFTDVKPGNGLGNFSLTDIMEQHVRRADKPCFSGAMFGHIEDKRTMPVGGMVRMDADAGTVTMLESAVL